eukprot:3118409-Heterocapsa_arctica.AAC.1
MVGQCLVLLWQVGMGWHSSKELFEEAKEMPAWIIKNNIKVYTDDTREKMTYKFYGLYQQSDIKFYGLTLEDMLKMRYQNIRPAPGHQSQPDHRERQLEPKFILTVFLMMLPGASVSALVSAHPDVKYLSVGQVN